MDEILSVISVSPALKKKKSQILKRTSLFCRWETAFIVHGDCAVCLAGKLLQKSPVADGLESITWGWAGWLLCCWTAPVAQSTASSCPQTAPLAKLGKPENGRTGVTGGPCWDEV